MDLKPNKIKTVPLEDVRLIQMYHERYQNGMIIRIHIKKELVDVHNDDYTDILEERKYRRHEESFTLLGKHNKARPKISRLIKQHGEVVTYTHGMQRKDVIEMSGEELLKLL